MRGIFANKGREVIGLEWQKNTGREAGYIPFNLEKLSENDPAGDKANLSPDRTLRI